MPSTFERTTKKLVKEIGDQELRPVKSLLSATKIRRFSLIQRKKARSWFWQRPDEPLDASLMDILEPGSSVPDAAVEVSVLFSDTEVSKQQAAGSVNAGAEVGFSGETAACQESSLDIQIVSTPQKSWTELQKRKLLDPEPYFLKQCREAGVKLYVVTDTVELRNSPVLPDLSSANVSGKFFFPLNIFVKGEGQGGGLKVRKKTLTVPKGSVLAYTRKQLVFYGREWEILHIIFHNDAETFQADKHINGIPSGFQLLSGIGESLDKYSKAKRICLRFPAGTDEPPSDTLHITDDDDDDGAGDDDDEKTFSAGTDEPPSDKHINWIPSSFQLSSGSGESRGTDEPPSDKYSKAKRICLRFPAGTDEPPSDTLHITDDDDDDGAGDDDDEKTFSAGTDEPPSDKHINWIPSSFQLSSAGICQPQSLSGSGESRDFKLLQEEVSQNIKAAELSKDMQGVVFSKLLAMLGDREALQDLMDKLEEEPFGHLDGPGGTILTELRKDFRYPEVGSGCLILYLLEGLMVLSDIQHVLLAQSMEKRILLPQRDLVRSILEPNFNCSENTPFTLQPELLAPLQGEALAITYGLLDECGLKMELNSPRSTWDPEAKEPLCALYAALSVLSQLAEA